ncbi:MAG: coproporphyrinogen III oxidase [Spirulina sp. SIO3F2]|nr:coproporphyrinogen III oxidase [Spirulina sp. SIO3F2]
MFGDVLPIESVITAAYVHIPFCRRRCFYCDFPVSVLGDRRDGSNAQSVGQYVEVLCQEIRTTLVEPGLAPLKTIFFGGGTPSLLTPKQLEQILTSLDRACGIAPDAECSIEIDPGTFDLAKLQAFKALGINRFSLGVQAFQNTLLQACGRSHTVADSFTAVEMLHSIGAKNWSLDLISGLPHQTLEDWQVSLEKAIALSPTHLSCYDLVLEPVTAFGKQYEPGATPLPTDTLTAEMYRTAQAVLTTAGYQHYEISNYAQPGAQCRHNLTYWHNQAYYGFGMGAASYTQGQRFTRPRSRATYYPWVAQGCPITVAPQTTTDQLLETLMVGLRLAEGVDLGKFSAAQQTQIQEAIAPYLATGWVKLRGNQLALGDPDGFLFSNTILASLFEQFD